MDFDHDKAQSIHENGNVIWFGINLGFSMFHVYVGGGSYLHKICLTLRLFYYSFCACDESCWG